MVYIYIYYHDLAWVVSNLQAKMISGTREFLSGATDFVDKNYIENWGIYTFRKDGKKYVEDWTLFWADLLLSKVLIWEKDASTTLWSTLPFMATNSKTKRASLKNKPSSTENSKPTSNSTISKSSTILQRKKLVIVDSSADESDSGDDPKIHPFQIDESSADVISPSSADKLGESTALLGSLSKSDRILSTRAVEGDKKKGTQDYTNL